MPLRIPDPPAEGLGIIRSALSSAMNQPASTMASVIAEAGPENLTTAAPHQIFFVGLRDIAEGRLLEAAQVVGWRYLIFKGEQPLAAAELKVGAAEGRLEFSNLNRGLFVGSTIEGVARAEDMAVVRDNDFELRLLDIPSLYVVALWLHGDSEILIPLPPSRPELEQFTPYSEEEVIARLRQPARERLELDERSQELGTN
jgi:hypothetical protein